MNNIMDMPLCLEAGNTIKTVATRTEMHGRSNLAGNTGNQVALAVPMATRSGELHIILIGRGLAAEKEKPLTIPRDSSLGEVTAACAEETGRAELSDTKI